MSADRPDPLVAIGELAYEVRVAHERTATIAAEVRGVVADNESIRHWIAIDRPAVTGERDLLRARVAAQDAEIHALTTRLEATGSTALQGIDAAAAWFKPSPAARGALVVAVVVALAVGGRLIVAVENATLNAAAAQMLTAISHRLEGGSPPATGSAIPGSSPERSDDVRP